MPSSVLHPAQSLETLKSTLPHAAMTGNISLLFPFAFSIMFAVFHGEGVRERGKKRERTFQNTGRAKLPCKQQHVGQERSSH